MAKNREPRTAPEVNWLDGAAEHDFPAAASYLNLLAVCACYHTDENLDLPAVLVDR